MLTVVCWKWGTGLYNSEHVNRLARAVKRHLHIPYNFYCIADDPAGIYQDINIIPLSYLDGKRNARRLWIFSDAAAALGSTLLQIDLDMIITGDITPLVSSFLQSDDNFKIWKCRMSSRYKFGLNPSFMMLRTGLFGTGLFDHVWQGFAADPEARLIAANRNGWPASDQAIISDTFTTPIGLTEARILCPVWTSADGIISMRDELLDTAQHPNQNLHTPLPPNTRLVSFHGRFDPAQYTQLDWVKEHWLN